MKKDISDTPTGETDEIIDSTDLYKVKEQELLLESLLGRIQYVEAILESLESDTTIN